MVTEQFESSHSRPTCTSPAAAVLPPSNYTYTSPLGLPTSLNALEVVLTTQIMY